MGKPTNNHHIIFRYSALLQQSSPEAAAATLSAKQSDSSFIRKNKAVKMPHLLLHQRNHAAAAYFRPPLASVDPLNPLLGLSPAITGGYFYVPEYNPHEWFTGSHPAYQPQNNNQYWLPSYARAEYHYPDGIHYHWNRPATFAMPSRRQNVTAQGRRYTNPDWTRRGGYIQESVDETMMVHGVGQERENPTTRFTSRARPGGLTEEVITKYLTTKHPSEVRSQDEDGETKLCVVCQDDLCQQDQKIGVLGCGHEYHVLCIKEWLRHKNICPLCKNIALVLHQ